MDNPYIAPSSNPHGAESFGVGNDGVTVGVVSQLAQTKGWVRLMAVLGFISSGFMLLAAVGMLVGGATFAKGMKNTNMSAGTATGMFAAAGVVYLVMGLFQIYPALKLNQFASAIARLILSGRVSDLADAIEHQRVFWKFVGVLLMLFLLMMVALLFLGPMLASVD